MERFKRTLKYEEVYLKGYGDQRDTRQQLRIYMDFYNSKRPHVANDEIPPAIAYGLATRGAA